MSYLVIPLLEEPKITPNSVNDFSEFNPMITLEEFFDKLNKHICDNIYCPSYCPYRVSQSTCRINKIEQLRPDKRQSFIYDMKYIILCQELEEFCQKNELYSPTEKVSDYCYDSYSYNFVWELIKYNKGGHFSKHKDKIIERYRCIHTHVALIYPKWSEYTGGDLIICGDEEVNIKTSDFEGHTLIILDIDTYHRITEVISDSRYVFKIPLYKINKNYKYDPDDECLES